jgi:hypothetical protein
MIPALKRNDNNNVTDILSIIKSQPGLITNDMQVKLTNFTSKFGLIF